MKEKTAKNRLYVNSVKYLSVSAKLELWLEQHAAWDMLKQVKYRFRILSALQDRSSCA